ncbi:MAG: adenosylhomocysteine nucleosidase [Clostridiales bacterium]|jgi:adenosylhomocysteine nucleosidase|nr:adenosylhomocysteine nucleosidase [Clostridiales bacterium]
MKIGIIGAMDIETEKLIEAMDSPAVHTVAGMSFYAGKLREKEVVVVTCGVGKVNAAACTQVLISEFKTTVVINTGVSGAIEQILNVGDIIISTDCMEHDMDCTGFGYGYGVIPRMESSVFEADPHLVDLAYEGGKEVVKGHQVLKGRIVSGDQFIASLERKRFIQENFSAHTTEMEGAAIAHVCHLNKIPFVIIRAISDKADGSAHVSFDDFAVEAAENSNRIVNSVLDGI